MMQTGKGIGMQILNDVLFDLVEKEVVEADEAISKALDKDGLKNKLKAKGLFE